MAGVSEQVASYFSTFPLRQYPKGQILMFAGDKPRSIYYLIEGRVKQYDLSYRGDEVILNIFREGAFFPMSVAVNQTGNEYFYEAETAVTLRQVPIDDVLAFIKSNPDVLFDLLSRVYRGTDALLKRIAYLMAGSARSRLLYELLIEARRFGTLSKDGSCVVNINESDLGGRAGLSRETVNREVKKLKKEGLLEVGHKEIKIIDLAKIEQALGKVL